MCARASPRQYHTQSSHSNLFIVAMDHTNKCQVSRSLSNATFRSLRPARLGVGSTASIGQLKPTQIDSGGDSKAVSSAVMRPRTAREAPRHAAPGPACFSYCPPTAVLATPCRPAVRGGRGPTDSLVINIERFSTFDPRAERQSIEKYRRDFRHIWAGIANIYERYLGG